MKEPKLCECGCGELAPIAKQTRTGRGFVRGEPQRFVRGHKRKPKRTLLEAFMEHFVPGNPGECWEWQGPMSAMGYGRVSLNGDRILAHRASYLIFNGELAEGIEACHECDNRPCVNPEHLFAGTHADNMADMVSKGRQCVGESRKDAKLTERIVREIRALAGSGVIQAHIARQYDIRQSHVALIVNKKLWKHVE